MEQVSSIQIYKRNMRYGIENRGIACTDRAIAADTYTPWRWLVYHTEIVLHAIRACSRLRDNVCGSRLGSLDLHEALCTNSLVTASGMINIGWVILRSNFVSNIHDSHGDNAQGNKWDTRLHLDRQQLLGIVSHPLLC